MRTKGGIWVPSAPAIITRRKLLTGAAVLAGASALGIEPALASVTFVNKVNSNVYYLGRSTVTTAPMTPLTAGNFVVVGVLTNRASNTGGFSIADTAGNTFHLVSGGPYNPGSTWGLYIYHIYNAIGNANNIFTITCLPSGNFPAQICVAATQFSGLPTTNPSSGVLANFETTPPGGAINSGSLTLTGSEGVVYALMAIDTSGGAPIFTAGSGFTAQLMDNTGGIDYFRDEYKIVSVSTAATATVTGTMFPNDISAALFQTGGAAPAAGKPLFHATP